MKKSQSWLQRGMHTCYVALCVIGTAHAWTKPIPTTPETDAAIERFAAMSTENIQGDLFKRIGDLTLIPPKINTKPLPEFDYDRLDYAMMLGIERTPGGRLWALWVAGEDGPKAFMVAATSDDNGQSWSKPRLVVNAHIPGFPIYRSVIVGNFWTDPMGRLWFFFDQTINHYDGRQGLWASRCENPDADTPVWSEPVRIWHGALLNKPTVMANGEWWLPVEFPAIGPVSFMRDVHEALNPLRGANVLVSTDQGRTWELRGRVRFSRPSWDEHMFLELKDGRVWMVARIGDRENGVMQSFSSDGGHTWSEPTRPTFAHPPSRFHICRLASGRILLIKHGETIDAHEGRSKLTAWLSEDDGATWRGGLMLDERKAISYPDAIEGKEGTIFIAYDHQRTPLGEIYMARIHEEDILARKLVHSTSGLKIPVVRTPKTNALVQHVLKTNTDTEALVMEPMAILEPTKGEVGTLEEGGKIFDDRDYTFFKIPASLVGRRFVYSPLQQTEAVCTQSGMAYVLAPTPARNSTNSPEDALRSQGFRRASVPEFVITLIGGKARERETCSVYQKHVEVGETIRFGSWGVLVF